MRREQDQRLGALVRLAIVLLPATTGAVLAAEQGDPRARALAAYDAGDCAAALPLLAGIDAAGAADGTWLYRLYYCQREAGQPEARDTLTRARAALEAAFAAEPALETGFYLANVQRNVGRVSAAAEVAATVTSKVESGAMPGPATPLERFQLGKLYADQEQPERAAELYATALEGLIVPGEPPSPSAQWAARYLAERAWAGADWAAAARYYRLLEGPAVTEQELDRLAIALARQKEYREAAQAWFRALRLNPAGGDRARYNGQLATQAAAIAPLPETAPDGRPWGELAGEELGQILYDNAQIANAAQQEVVDPDALTPERRAELQAGLKQARMLFISAGIEAAVRGVSLREDAFQSGYAPLIFHDTRWFLPAPTKRKGQKPKPTADPPTDGSAGS